MGSSCLGDSLILSLFFLLRSFPKFSPVAPVFPLAALCSPSRWRRAKRCLCRATQTGSSSPQICGYKAVWLGEKKESWGNSVQWERAPYRAVFKSNGHDDDDDDNGIVWGCSPPSESPFYIGRGFRKVSPFCSRISIKYCVCSVRERRPIESVLFVRFSWLWSPKSRDPTGGPRCRPVPALSLFPTPALYPPGQLSPSGHWALLRRAVLGLPPACPPRWHSAERPAPLENKGESV